MAKIDIAYHKLLQEIKQKGFKYEDPNRKDVYRYQIPNYQIQHNFSDGFPAITTKKLYWKGIVKELLWILRGDTNIKYLVNNGINIWNKDAYNYAKLKCNYNRNIEEFINDVKKSNKFHGYTFKLGNLGKIYGAQWRNFNGIKNHKVLSNFPNSVDQFSNLIKGLKKTPMGTKHIVTAWNPAELKDMALPPCHWSFEILVEPLSVLDQTLFVKDNGKKNWIVNAKRPKYQFTLKWHQRSVDTFLGLPFNIASYALLAQIIGKMTNMIPKDIIGDLSNVHIYEPHMDAVNKQLKNDTNKYEKCELDDFSGFKMDMHENVDQWLNSKEIPDFNLKEYNSYPSIPAKMLAYDN